MIYGVAALMAIAAVVVYFVRQPAPTAGVSQALLEATTAEAFQTVADGSPESPIGILARLRQADSELEDAVSKMFTDREAAKVHLESAAKAYQQLEDRNDINDSVRERVRVGLARVAECRCDGTDDAINAATAAWDRVLKTIPQSKTFKAIAESRIKRLASNDSKEFYKWFSTQNPKPGDDLLMPQDGVPGQVPSAPLFPDLHNFGLPGATAPTPTATTPAAPAENPVSAETPSEATPSADKPAETPADPDAADTPATEPPATEPPATEPPATEPPATEPPATEPPATEPPAADVPAGDDAPAESPAAPPAADAPKTEAPVGEAPTPEKSGE